VTIALWAPRVDPAFAAAIDAAVAAAVAPDAERVDREDVYPLAAVQALARAGLTAAGFPIADGGGGRPLRDLVAVFEAVAAASAATATSLVTIFQAGAAIQLFGGDALRRRYLPRIAAGLVCSFAMTEARGGSDVRRLDTRARRVDDGWVIDGRKAFVTSASAAELFVLLAQTDAGVTAFAVPAARAGAGAGGDGPHDRPAQRAPRRPHPRRRPGSDDHRIGEDGHGVPRGDGARPLAGAGRGDRLQHRRAALRHAGVRRSPPGRRSPRDQPGHQWYLADCWPDRRGGSDQAAGHLDAAGPTHHLPRGLARPALASALVGVGQAGRDPPRCTPRCRRSDLRRARLRTAPFGRLRDAKYLRSRAAVGGAQERGRLPGGRGRRAGLTRAA
jgi:hypothetical protein